MRTFVGFLIGIAFVGAVVYVALQQSSRVECTVCMAYNGRQKCETAAGPDSQQAMMQAVSSACAQISGGVTDGIQCSNSPPLSQECRP